MSAIFAIVKNDLLQRVRDPLSFMIWIAIPLLVGGLITVMSGGAEGPKPTARLLLVNQDDSVVSQFLSGAFSADALAGLIKVENNSETEAREKMSAGKASAMLLIPAGFGSAVLREKPASLLLLTNPSQRILPGIIEGIVATFVEGIFYLHRIFGEEIKTIEKMMAAPTQAEMLEDLQIADLSVAINHAVNDLAPYIFPPLIKVEQVVEPESGTQEKQVNLGLLFFPGMLLMGLFFCAMALADEFWAERERGTLQRIVVGPLGLGQILLAKSLTAAVTLAAVAAIIMLIGFAYHGLAWSLVLPTLLWLIAGGLLLFAMMSALQIVAPSRKAASMLSTMLVFPLMMMGGSFFPLEIMPDWLASIGRFSPNGYVITRLQPYLNGSTGVWELVQGLLVITPPLIILMALVRIRLPAFARD